MSQKVIQLNPEDPSHLIPYAITHHPGTVAVLPIYTPAAPQASLIMKAQKRVKRIPAHVAAQLAGPGNGPVPTEIELGRALIQLPTDVVRNIQGPDEGRDLIFMFVVRRSVYDKVKRQAESRIILPEEGLGL